MWIRRKEEEGGWGRVKRIILETNIMVLRKDMEYSVH